MKEISNDFCSDFFRKKDFKRLLTKEDFLKVFYLYKSF